MNEKTRKKILELHKKGLTAYEIAKRLSVSYGGVRYVTDPAFREYMSQAHKKYFAELKGTPEAQTPPGHSNITQEDIEWLSQHRQSVEHRSRILKGIGVYAIYLIIVSAFASALTAYIATALIAINATATLFLITVFLIGLIMAFVSVITPDKYIKEGVIGIISGFIVGIALALIVIL